MSDQFAQLLEQLDALREEALADEQAAAEAAADARRRRVQLDAALRALGRAEQKPAPKRRPGSRGEYRRKVSDGKFDVIRRALADAYPDGLAQKELTAATGLNQSLISAAVRQLLDADELRQVGTTPSKNGRMQIPTYGLMDRAYPNTNGRQ